MAVFPSILQVVLGSCRHEACLVGLAKLAVCGDRRRFEEIVY